MEFACFQQEVPLTKPAERFDGFVIDSSVNIDEDTDDTYFSPPISQYEEVVSMTDENRQSQNQQNVLIDTSNVNDSSFSNGRPKKGRKQKYKNQNRQTRKMNCIQNKEYIGKNGKLYVEKEFRQYVCSCGCFDRVGEKTLKTEFKKFYSVSSHDAQRALICNMVKEVEIKRKRVKHSDKRKKSRIYQICGNLVCKPFFLQTFRISSCKVNTALKAFQRPEGVRDLRGISGGHNKICGDRVEKVMEHIRKFPKYKSHYRREDTEREFLSCNTTLDLMYTLYKSEVLIDPVSKSFYKHIFLTKFNLQRKKLKKDTCFTCDRLQVLISNSEDEAQLAVLKEEKETHLTLAENAQENKTKDMKAAENNPDLETLCFDLEKTLPLPRIPTNVVFYKRQLWVYNLGIHSGKEKRGHCYVWVEGEAGRGAQEVGSCLRKHIQEEMGPVKELILWSDSCGGQNRNIKIVLLLKSILEEHPTLEKITMKFLVPGHTFLPNDSDFGDIESALKLQQRIYTPEDYIRVMESCKKRNPLCVHRTASVDFVGTDKIEAKVTNRKKYINGQAVSWLKSRVVEVRKSKPYSIFMKTKFEGVENELDIKKRTPRGRPLSAEHGFSTLLEPLWPRGKPISIPKLNDLKSMMELIPSDAKPVYQRLFASAGVEDDIDGFDGELDFEMEESDD